VACPVAVEASEALVGVGCRDRIAELGDSERLDSER